MAKITEKAGKQGIYSAPEIMEMYTDLGAKKSAYPIWKMLLLGLLAGMVIACGAVAATTASYDIANTGLARLLTALVFSLGLGIILLIGAELFTGNCMIFISVLSKKTTFKKMLKNWLFVYIGNMCGAILIAGLIILSGQIGMGNGQLAVTTINIASAKCSPDFIPAVAQGILCNFLVCIAVLCSLSAKDTTGRIFGAYIPVVLFVTGGFEHCIADMYYIPAGILANLNSTFSAMADDAGISTASLTLRNFFSSNLLPVTIGNIIGGVGVSTILWICHRKKGIPK